MTMSTDDSEEEENFHFLGTPLDPITEEDKHEDAYSRRRPRPVPVHEQRVLDERGRPLRFHGAFQGGFSAGHFNTVADPEGRGFTPAAFVSRRQRKKDDMPVPKRARPEDFMDAEDFNEFGIAPRTFHTAADFENTAARSTGDIVMDMVCPIRPIKSPIAIRLMRRFGWREGQSIGAIKNRSNEESEADEEVERALLASDTASHIKFVPKTNTFGLGYSGIDPRTALFGGGLPVEKPGREVLLGERGRRGIRGHAFGVSVLEEDDDDDVYGQPSLKDYDWAIGGPEGDEEERSGAGLHGWTAPKERKSPQKRPVGYVGKVLKGFRVGPPLNRSSSVRFPVPFLPAWFVPLRGANKGLLREPGDPEKGSKEEANSAGPGASVFDFISREDRVRLELARRKAAPKLEPRPPEIGAKEAVKGAVLADLRVPDRKKEKATGASRWSRWDSKPSAPPPSPSPPQTSASPTRSSEEAVTVKSEPVEAPGSDTRKPLTIHFRPFAKDKEKQARFETFCNSPLMQQQPKEAYAALVPAHFTEWEAQHEEEEFVKAARIYRPLSSMLASRFHRGEDIQLDETTGAIKSIPLPPEKKERSSREIAAAEKRFGSETRRSVRWHPHPLLCRRFNVPEPYPGSEVIGLESSQQKRKEDFSIFDLVGLGSRNEAEKTDASAIEAPPVMSREEVQRKRKSVFSCLFEDPKPSTSSGGKTQRVEEPASSSEHSSDASKAKEPSLPSWKISERVQEPAAPPPPVSVDPIAQNPPESSSENELPSSPALLQEDEPPVENKEERIPMDIFKAIFADSEESEEEEEEEKEESKPAIEEKKTVAPSRAMTASSLFQHLFDDDKGPAEKTSENSSTKGTKDSEPGLRKGKDNSESFERNKEKTKDSSISAGWKTKGEDAKFKEQNHKESFGAELPPHFASDASSSKQLSSNEFLLRLAAGELSEKVKKVKKKKKKEKHVKRSKTSKKSKKKKRKHKKANSSSSSTSSEES